jgi:hypothetical protein
LLYKICRTTGTKSISQMQQRDAINFITKAGFEGVEYENKVAVAYSLSKMFVTNEMMNFGMYNIMKKVEFYEFIGRISYLIYSDSPAT